MANWHTITSNQDQTNEKLLIMFINPKAIWNGLATVIKIVLKKNELHKRKGNTQLLNANTE